MSGCTAGLSHRIQGIRFPMRWTSSTCRKMLYGMLMYIEAPHIAIVLKFFSRRHFGVLVREWIPRIVLHSRIIAFLGDHHGMPYSGKPEVPIVSWALSRDLHLHAEPPRAQQRFLRRGARSHIERLAWHYPNVSEPLLFVRFELTPGMRLPCARPCAGCAQG